MADESTPISPLRILIIDDEENIRTTLGMCLEADGHTIVAHDNINDALAEIGRRVFDLVFLDLRLGLDSGMDFLPTLRDECPWARVIVITAYASIDTAVEAMKRGAADYLPKPFDASEVQRVTREIAERRRLDLKIESLQAALGAGDPEADLPTHTPAMADALELARQVAPSNTPVLIRGEPGTGKRRVARAIHAWSTRAEAPFTPVACEAGGDALEAQLFGVGPAHAPDGAQRSGRVAFCDGGTLLLDEVGQSPPSLQAKLLRLLHDHEYERTGEVAPRSADVRVIATTSADLQAAVQAGTFRADLLLCLDVVQIVIPPLRSRPDDISLLAERYLAYFGRENRRLIAGFTHDALHALRQYAWPGNLRELRNVVERAVLLCPSQRIDIEHLPPNLLNSGPACAVGDRVSLETLQKSHILHVVAATRSLRRAASILGVDSSTLWQWLKRYRASDDQPAA